MKHINFFLLISSNIFFLPFLLSFLWTRMLRFIKIVNLKVLIFVIIGIGLLSCSSSPPLNDSPSGVQPQEALLPIWQQTEYIFYNRTGAQVTVILVKKGKVIKKDGTVLERSNGGVLGEDGIFREFILNEQGEQEYVTREYKETSLELKDGECVFTPSYYVLEIKIQGQTVCDTPRHGKPDSQRFCDTEVNQVRGEKGWRDTSKRGESPFSYVEFYNIVNKNNLFEGVEEPREFDDSFTHSCQMLVSDDYKPWTERMDEFNKNHSVKTR